MIRLDKEAQDVIKCECNNFKVASKNFGTFISVWKYCEVNIYTFYKWCWIWFFRFSVLITNKCSDFSSDSLSFKQGFTAISNKYCSSTFMKLKSTLIGLISLQASSDSNVDNCVTCGAIKSATSTFPNKFGLVSSPSH